jgi:hypothetical protein
VSLGGRDKGGWVFVQADPRLQGHLNPSETATSQRVTQVSANVSLISTIGRPNLPQAYQSTWLYVAIFT